MTQCTLCMHAVLCELRVIALTASLYSLIVLVDWLKI